MLWVLDFSDFGFFVFEWDCGAFLLLLLIFFKKDFWWGVFAGWRGGGGGGGEVALCGPCGGVE